MPILNQPPWPWRNSFAALGNDFLTSLPPQGLPAPHWVARCEALAADLGIARDWFGGDDALQALAGNALLPGAAPGQSLASVYSGHQFGQWAGQLGDGRALLLGGLQSNMHWPGVGQVDELEIQLKGAGLTPYSRMGDGRAVLRSSVREYLCSEAMHGLGIATTRALAIVGSPQPVRREEIETAAVVTRVAPSFIRFGHFEHFSASGQTAQLKQLADHVIGRFYPACRDAANPYAALLQAVSERTMYMVASWQAVGFCHGVMNTDNMSILGLTIDYGPFGFLDSFNPNHICNHSDGQGRYAYNKQPNVAYWNLFCLGQALMPLIDDQEAALAALEPFRTAFPALLQVKLAAKLGIAEPHARTPEAKSVVDSWLKLLASAQTDFTASHAAFTAAWAEPKRMVELRDLFVDRESFDAWLLQFVEQQTQWNRRHLGNIASNSSSEGVWEGFCEALPAETRYAAEQLCTKSNPQVVLRNHLAQNAIQSAQAGDFSEIGRLQQALANPFAVAEGMKQYAAPPPAWAQSLEVSCSS